MQRRKVIGTDIQAPGAQIAAGEVAPHIMVTKDATWLERASNPGQRMRCGTSPKPTVSRWPAPSPSLPAKLRTATGTALDPVDTVGAVDSFNAGFMAGLLDTGDLERALALEATPTGPLSRREAGATIAQPTGLKPASRPELCSFAPISLRNTATILN